ncbi:hypothetical protein D3C77_280400 [compost metagenome]
MLVSELVPAAFSGTGSGQHVKKRRARLKGAQQFLKRLQLEDAITNYQRMGAFCRDRTEYVNRAYWQQKDVSFLHRV